MRLSPVLYHTGTAVIRTGLYSFWPLHQAPTSVFRAKLLRHRFSGRLADEKAVSVSRWWFG
jgi:hypothetical protein